MSELSQEQINHLRESDHIRDILGPDGTINNASKIITSNFGSVPPVIYEEIIRILASKESQAIETYMSNKVLPGDKLGFEGLARPTLYAIRKKPDNTFKEINILSIHNVSGNDLKWIPNLSNYQAINDNNELLDQHLLQTGDFRLVSGATPVDEQGFFAGHYEIPEKYPFLNSRGVLPFSFMQEVANQIAILAFSKTTNSIEEKNKQTLSFNSMHTSYFGYDHISPMHYTENSDKLTVMGRMYQDQEKTNRGLIIDYTLYVNGNSGIKGSIIGTKISIADILETIK